MKTSDFHAEGIEDRLDIQRLLLEVFTRSVVESWIIEPFQLTQSAGNTADEIALSLVFRRSPTDIFQSYADIIQEFQSSRDVTRGPTK
ncbi:hypothetical protein I5L01_15245 [Erythrobacter sp. YJ-T3-07]|uniref:hypothetical protein n=1 Tax=Erythrobacter sp. YJ-T3-07 TaxID=2793063 RepID=UPI0018D435D6|nr:hypothetical protein [Erythrobacter sp. YJ-T3-07]MBH1945576.1 hypothetical protein [Erythrobacter sp. YJ-T3-07]